LVIVFKFLIYLNIVIKKKIFNIYKLLITYISNESFIIIISIICIIEKLYELENDGIHIFIVLLSVWIL